MPAGFMPVVANGVILVQLCSGQGPQTIALELPGKTGEHDHGEHKKAEAPCAFSGLSSPTLAAADALLAEADQDTTIQHLGRVRP